jgi:NADPH-dependent F420 reductase
MRIGIIGAGNVGRALAESGVRAGHTVTVSSRSPEDAELVAKETGARAAASNREAINTADVVILAVGYPDIDTLLGEIGDALPGKIVVEVSNRVNPNNPGLVIDGTSNAEEVQRRIPAARVVKAFNTIFASLQTNPIVEGVKLDGYVAGDDEEAKAAALDFVESIGLRPIDAGPLSMARALEAMATLIIFLQIRDSGSWQSGWKILDPTATT